MPASTPPIDVAAAHRYFAAECFNGVWGLIEKSDRSPVEEEEMVLGALASLWHWMQRDDCHERQLSVGHWQIARAYALVGQADNAMRHGRQALRFAEGLTPFYIGYAHEAIARAAQIAGDRRACDEHLELAVAAAQTVADPRERGALEEDLRLLAMANEA